MREDLPKAVAATLQHLAPVDASAEARRVLKRFAVVAVAGELAIDYGMLPWPHRTVLTAVEHMVHRYLTGRGGAGAGTDRAINAHPGLRVDA